MTWKFGIPVVDGHIHVNRFDLMKEGPRSVIEQNPTFAKMLPLIEDPHALLRLMDEEGIWQTWLINYSARDVMGYGWEVNPWVADYVKADPERLIAVGGYDPRHDGDGAEAIDALRAMGISALKVHPVHQCLSPAVHREDSAAGRAMADAYARAEERRMPVIIHTGTSVFPGADNTFQHVAPIRAMCEDYPGLPVILAHGGRPHEGDEALAIVADHPNAWLDLSSLPPKRIPQWFGDLDAPLADGPPLFARTLWGSDWPGPKVPGMGANVQAYLDLGFSDEANRAVLHDNITALLGRVR